MSALNSLSPEIAGLLKLHLIPGLGPRLTAALLQRFGSAEGALAADEAQLREVPHIGPKLARAMVEAIRRLDLVAECALIEKHRVQLLARGTPNYPKPLQQISDPPFLLYMRGALADRDARAVAIVGSRHCTAYGRRTAERLAAGLVERGYTVVSGLARGIDGAAHRATLKAGGRTIAVLAGGLSRIYPPEHTELAAEIETAGALLTESAMTMEPMAGMFPARNRLISGFSLATVIVEAAERSGALITASHAADQGKPVMAIPGNIDSAASGGTNALIRKGAILVRNVEDIVEELEGIPAPAMSAPPAVPQNLDDNQKRVWDFLGERPRHVDEIADELQIPIPTLAGMLMMLEMKKVVRRLPGNMYERV